MQAAMIETLVLNDLTIYGLRRMHVVRMGKPVELDNWRDQVPGEATEVTVARTHEADLDVHHLWLVWNGREIVNFVLPDGREVWGALWWITESVSWSTDLAANLYVMKTGQLPSEVWMSELPKGATDEITVDITGQGELSLKLVKVDWVPKRFVIAVNGGLRHGKTEAVEMPERARDGAGNQEWERDPAAAALPAVD